jgi:kanamycin nucleotidyltransferase
MFAGAVIGSVAHGAAATHSDVELVIVTAATVDERDEYFFDEGVMVECAVVQAERLLASARSVPWNWGIKADAYRHQVVVWDPDGFFERLRTEATSIPDKRFERALGESWWIIREERDKLRNALADGDEPRAVYLGWEFAYGAAMRIALDQRTPYESGRTLWRDSVSRGHGMGALIDALVGGAAALSEVRRCVDDVWSRMSAWSPPPSEREAP